MLGKAGRSSKRSFSSLSLNTLRLVNHFFNIASPAFYVQQTKILYVNTAEVKLTYGECASQNCDVISDLSCASMNLACTQNAYLLSILTVGQNSDMNFYLLYNT